MKEKIMALSKAAIRAIAIRRKTQRAQGIDTN